MFNVNDLVVPKGSDIVCRVERIRNETMVRIYNGHGNRRWVHESQLEHLSDASLEYVMSLLIKQ